MKSAFYAKRSIFWVMATLILLLIGTLALNHRSLRNRIDKEKIRNEALLSSNLDLEKSIDKMKGDLQSLRGKNEDLDRRLRKSDEELTKKEARIRKLTQENASIGELKQRIEALEMVRTELEEGLAVLSLELEAARKENLAYVDQLEALKARNEQLAMHAALMEALLTDNYRIEALKGKNDKLTISARRANKLAVSFDIPPGFVNQVHFKLITPEQKEISSIENTFASVTRYDQGEYLLASMEGGILKPQKASSRLELNYQPVEKLTRGTYQFHLYDGAHYLGSIQLRLK